MSVQTNYNYTPDAGAAGGLYDLSPYAIDAYANQESNGVMKLGLGVVAGTTTKSVKKPVSGSTAANFIGVTVNGRTNEHDLTGTTLIRNKATVGVMRYGRIYVQVKAGLTIAAGDAVYLVKAGDDAGKFSNVSTDNIAIKAKFLGPVSSIGVAPIHLYDTPHA